MWGWGIGWAWTNWVWVTIFGIAGLIMPLIGLTCTTWFAAVVYYGPLTVLINFWGWMILLIGVVGIFWTWTCWKGFGANVWKRPEFKASVVFVGVATSVMDRTGAEPLVGECKYMLSPPLTISSLLSTESTWAGILTWNRAAKFWINKSASLKVGGSALWSSSPRLSGSVLTSVFWWISCTILRTMSLSLPTAPIIPSAE